MPLAPQLVSAMAARSEDHRAANNGIISFYVSTLLPKARGFRCLNYLTSKWGGSSWAQVWVIKLRLSSHCCY
jgi:hypothetical protein